LDRIGSLLYQEARLSDLPLMPAMLLDVVYDSVHLLRRHFVFTALLDLAVLLSWLAAIVFRVLSRVYLIFGLVTLVVIPYNFARHTTSYTPPRKKYKSFLAHEHLF
jgi:hypothetical protein